MWPMPVLVFPKKARVLILAVCLIGPEGYYIFLGCLSRNQSRTLSLEAEMHRNA